MIESLSSQALSERLVLGTVKFGVAYGYDKMDKLDSGVAHKVLSKAYDLGMNYYDTAPSYGEAETILGDCFESRSVNFITKVLKVESSVIDDNQIDLLQKSFDKSLDRMSVECCYGLLIHDVGDLNKPGSEKIIDWIYALKDQGLVKKVGVSVYTPKEAKDLYELFSYDLIQLPCNLFDQRFITSNCLEWLKQKGVEIHARSLFLKGVLLRSGTISSIPEKVNVQNERLTAYLDKKGWSRFDYCWHFANLTTDVDKWVIGASKTDHLDAFSTVSVLYEEIQEMSEWSINDQNSIDPRLW